MMFLPILKAGSDHFDIEPDRVIGGTGAAVMDSLGLGTEEDPPSSIPKPLAPIDILSIHKEILVKEADLVQRVAPYHPDAPVDHINIAKSVMLKEGQHVPSKQL